MRKPILLIVVILVLGTIAILLYRAHYRVVTSGSLSGFEIGLSKEEVLSMLLARADVSAVQVRVPSFRVSAGNIGDLDGLEDVSAFLIQSPELQVTVYNDRGAIIRYRHQGVGSEMRDRPEGLGDLLPVLRDFLVTTPEASVISVPRGVGMTNKVQLSLHGREPPTEEMRRWLFSYDQWAFVEDDRWTFYKVFFADGKLVRIEFRNDFMELP